MTRAFVVLAGVVSAILACMSAPTAEAKGTMRLSSGTDRGCLTQPARALLGRIQAQFGRVQIVSTCRRGARVASTGKISKHATGEAIDFNAPSGKKQAVIKWLLANHHSGGIMTYSGMTHIHVDIGYRFVSLGSRARG